MAALCALYGYMVLCNAIYGWIVHRYVVLDCMGGKPRLSRVGGGGTVAGVAALILWRAAHTARRASGHAGTVGAAGAGGRHE